MPQLYGAKLTSTEKEPDWHIVSGRHESWLASHVWLLYATIIDLAYTSIHSKLNCDPRCIFAYKTWFEKCKGNSHECINSIHIIYALGHMAKGKPVFKCQPSHMRPNNDAVKAARCHSWCLYSAFYFSMRDPINWQHGRVCNHPFMEAMEVIIRTSERPVVRKTQRGVIRLPLNRVNIAAISPLVPWTQRLHARLNVDSLCKSSGMSIVQKEPTHKELSTQQRKLLIFQKRCVDQYILIKACFV